MNTQEAQEFELNITNKNELLMAYMPAIKNGGLFVPTKIIIQLGQTVTVNVKLWCLSEPAVITGKVVWVTPLHAQGGCPAGIGVQFAHERSTKQLKDFIEKQLAGLLQSDQLNSTL